MAKSVEIQNAMAENPRLQVIRGFPVSIMFKKEIIEEVFDFMPKEGDVVIATYPKTGTTWMQYIVTQILTNGESFPTFNDMLEKVVPFLEMSGTAPVEALTTRPRVYKHHFPYNAMKTNPKTKIIYVYRKPEDTLVSFYHFTKNLGVPYDFEEYFEDFLTGNISYGRYFEHVLSYLEPEENKNILLVSYEKLHTCRSEEILRIAKFLGEEYYSQIVNDESILAKIIDHTSFDYMKKNLKLLMSPDNEDKFSKDEKTQKEIPFFRKGIVGDGKNTLNEQQLKRLKSIATETMKGTNILNEWYNE